jgi:hypothetical protein
VVPVTLECIGNENALGFTVAFDAAKLTFASAAIGAGADGATLNININQATTGRVGLALALPPGGSLPAGVREIVRLEFAAKVGPPATCEITFGDQPIYRETSDSQANSLVTAYAAGTVTIAPPPGPPLSIVRSGSTMLVMWSASAVEFQLEWATDLESATWTRVNDVIPWGDQRLAAVPVDGARKFFRLKKP